MNKIYSLFIILIVLFLCQNESQAQISLNDTSNTPYWVDMMQDNSVNIYQTKRAFDLYWDGRTIEKGCGYKPFMRWFTSKEGIVDEFGNIPDPQLAIDEYNNFVNIYGIGNNQFNRGGVGSGTASCITSGDWKELGPTGLPTNQPSQPNGNGRINGLGFHPTDSNTFWAGAPQGGVWKTTDGGASWTSNTDNMPTLGVSDIAVHPSNGNIIYLGTGDRDAGDAAGLGVYKSTNGGTTWVASNTGMGNRTVSKVIIDPTTPTTVIAAVNGGIYRSTNSGGNWTRVVNGGNWKDIVFHPTNSSIVYASYSYRFYKSTDNGVTWTQITTGLPTSGYRGGIAVTAGSVNKVYFVVTGQRAFEGFYVSTNSGTSFTTASTTPNIMDYSHLGTGTGGQAFYDLDIAADPNNPNDVYVCGVNIFKSTDGGATWTINAHWVGSGGAPAIHADNHVMEFHPLTNAMIVGNDGGVFKATNRGANYTDITSDLRIAQIYRCAQSKSSKDWIINGYQDNGTGMMRGIKSWYTVMGGDGMDCQIDPSTTKYAYSDLYYGDVRRYTDGYYSGKIAADGTNGINQRGAWVTSFILQEGTPSTMYIGYDDVWKSTNIQTAAAGSVTWTKISSFTGATDIHYLENCISNPNTMYVSRKDGFMYKTTNLTAGTPTWTQCARPTNTYPRWIESDPTNANIVYIAQSNNIYKSTNGGTTWTDISSNLPNSAIHCIKYDSSAGQEALYVGTSVGVYFKDATMTNWVLFNGGLPTTSEITDLDIYYDPVYPECSHIISSTYGRGNWKSYLYPSAARKPKPRFYALDTTLNIGCGTASTQLFNESCDFPTRFKWEITPTVTYIGGTDSCSEAPIIQFNSAGAYTVKLVADNCNGIDSLEKTSYIMVVDSVKSATCIPTYSNQTSAVGILNVSLAGHSRSSSASNVASYTDYSCTDIIKLTPNTNYDLIATLVSINASGVAAFIDYNNDGDFVDAGESIGTVGTGVGAQTINFTTPANPLKGTPLRLRIVDRFSSTSITSCGGPYSYGEAEDYAIYFEPSDVEIARVGAQDSVCPGTIVEIVDSATAKASNYSWDFGTNATPSTATGPGPHQVKFGSIGYQNISVTSNGKTFTKDSIVFVKNGPNLKERVLYGTLPTCSGDSIVLSAVDSNATNPSYQWYKNNILISGETDTNLVFGNITSSDNGGYFLIADAFGCKDTSTLINVAANPKPVAAFAITSDTVQCLGGNNFTVNNTSSIGAGTMSYTWHFGDGITSTQTAPSHSYGSSNTYTVKLVVESSFGCADSMSKTVIVNNGPVADFTIADTSKCLGQGGFNYTNNSTGGGTYVWHFGDGTTATTNNANKTYGTANTYAVKLVATASGCSDSLIKQVHYNALPTVGFTVNKDTQCITGNSFVFTDTSKISSGTLSRNWDFGDGNSSTIGTANHTYVGVGNKTIKLISTSSEGCKDSVSKMVTVLASPIAAFTVNDSTQCISNNDFVFTNNSSNSLSYTWTYGDGASATTTNGQRNYANPNNYQISLIAESSGCKDTAYANVYVYELPKVGFTINNDTQCFIGNSFTFNDTSTIGLGTTNRVWDFGDGNSSSAQSPMHSYTSQGLRSVKLVSTSSNGCKDSVSKSVLTSPTPDAIFGVNDSAQCLNSNYYVFTNNSTISSGFVRYEWDFGNDSSSTTSNGTEAYEAAGDYTVKLRVFSMDGGCADSVTRLITVNPSPISSFTVDEDTQCFNGHLFRFTNASSISSGNYTDSFFFGDNTYSDIVNPTKTFSIYGSYTIEHRMVSNYGCLDTSKLSVDVFASPNASFSIADTGQCFRGHGFNLVNNSSIGAGTFSNAWDLGDGNSSSSSAFKQVYGAEGDYSIKLRVTSDQGCTDSMSQAVAVYPETEIGFTINKDTQCFQGHIFSLNDTSTITNGTYERLWKLGDNDTSSASSLGKIYGTQNNYTITLITTTDQGCMDSISKNAVLQHSTVASFTIDDNAQCLDGNSFQFTNSSTKTGGTEAFVWDFGDGASSNLKNPTHNYNVDSVRTVRLISSVVNGCKDTMERTLEIYPMPFVQFSIDDSLQCLSGNTFSFTDNSTVRYGTLTGHNWDFGDNTNFMSANSNHIYANDGSYTVTKIVTTNNNCQDSFKSQLEVYETPVSDFSVNKDSQCFVGNDFVFTNNSSIAIGTLQFAWDFGDNSSIETTKDAQYTYVTENGFDVKLVVTSNENCKDSISKAMVVMPNPVANFAILDTAQCLDGNAFAINNSTAVSSGTFASAWDFDDGNTSLVENPPSHTYSLDGVYTITYTATTSFGCEDKISNDLIVFPMPIASYNLNSLGQCLMGNSFTLTDNSTLKSGTIDARNWDFGDGNNSVNTTVENHSFLSSGNYDMRLEVESNKGCLDDTIVAVDVYAHPVSSFDNLDVCLGDSAYFFFTGSSDVTEYLWSFGDGGISNIQDAVRLYRNDGTYGVRLIATNANNCKDTSNLLDSIRIFPKPEAAFSSTKIASSGTAATMLFTDESIGATQWSWDFGDGNYSTSQNPENRFSDTGTFTTILSVENNFGCRDTINETKFIFPDYNFNVPTSFTPNEDGLNDVWRGEGLAYTHKFDLKVYNRWGEVVYATNDPLSAWDGTYLGSPLMNGVYIYIIHLEDLNHDVHNLSGELTILR